MIDPWSVIEKGVLDEKFKNWKEVEQEFVFDLSNTLMHAKFMPCKGGSETLIIRFHGAINREIRPLPSFQPNMRQVRTMAHQLTICDPTMTAREDFNMSWYLGHESFDLRPLLSSFVERLSLLLGAKRVIYVGSSGGGFAALHQSYYHPGSLALAIVPQTNVKRYHKGFLSRYFQACWPNLNDETELGRHVDLDLCELYRNGFENTVVFVQSSGDKFHFANHCAPFLEAASSANSDRIISQTHFWGRIRHSGAVPPEGYLPWLKAAISAPSFDVDDLLMTWYELSGELENNPVPRPVKNNSAEFTARDLDRSKLIRDFLLKS